MRAWFPQVPGPAGGAGATGPAGPAGPTGATGPAGPPGGANTEVQYNDGGVFGGDANFVYKKALQSLAVGTGSLASGVGSFATGGGQATALGAVACGASTASSNYCTAMGDLCNATNVDAVAIGEECNASGINAVSLGFANTSSGTYSCTLGAFLSATATGASARGVNASSIRAGQDSHSSGEAGGQGYSGLDLFADLNAAPGTVNLTDGTTALHLEQSSVVSMRVRVVASTLDGETAACEVREFLIITDTVGIRIVSPQTVYASPAAIPGVLPAGLAAQGWSLTIAATSPTNLTFTADPGAQEVRFLARVEWTELYNLIGSVFDPSTLSLTEWLRANYVSSPWVGTASAGVSGAQSASEAANPPTTGPLINGLTPALFDGADDLLTFLNTLATQLPGGVGSGWALIVVNAIASNGAAFANDSVISTQASGYFAIELKNTATPVVQLSVFDGATKSVFQAIPVGVPCLVTWRIDGTNAAIGVNTPPGAFGGSSTIAAGAIAAGGLTDTVRLGTNTSAVNFYNGEIVEIAQTGAVLTNAQFDNVREYVNARYDLDL